MPLRYQLLLLSLLTLLLPWAGCQYAREMENVLRDGQEQALLASAATIASFVATKPELIDATLSDGRASGDGPVDVLPFDPGTGDLYAYRLNVRPLLDGYPDDWALPEQAFAEARASGSPLGVRYIAGTDESFLYLLLRVTDPHVRMEQSGDAQLAPEERGDHVWIAFEDTGGAQQAYFFMTSAPGLISARRTTVSAYGERGERLEPRIQAYWQPDPLGYRLEARVPLSLIGGRVGFEVVDGGIAGNEAVRVGTLEPQTRRATGRLLRPSEALAQQLRTVLPSASRLIVGDPNGWIVAEAGTVELPPGAGDDADRPADWLQAIYRGLLESGREDLPPRSVQPGRLSGPQLENALRGQRAATWLRVRDERRSVLSVATPIVSGQERLGVLMIEQTGDRLLILRDRALTRLLNVTLLAAVLAVLGTLAFATLLGMRLGRLKRAAETALTRDGRLNVVIPETGRRDELGDLARSYASLLRRLNDYTSYLRTLGGKLSHELRTPLTIVRSSLENLESERAAGGNIGHYVSRAREGTERLQAILSAMGAATRTEEAIQHAERVRFDLRALLQSTTRAYADAFPQRRFESRLPGEECWVEGAPDLIVQLLDKLVDNAVDFSAPGGAIEIALDATEEECLLSVTNAGSHIPASVLEQLFDSMFQHRHVERHADGQREGANRPHFGLGLFIVRLVTEFHGGSVTAENITAPEGDAVRFALRLPRRSAVSPPGEVASLPVA